MKGVTYFRWWGFSINEGGGPVNVTAIWAGRLPKILYVYFYGRRFAKVWGSAHGS